MTTFLMISLWAALAGLAYIYVGYPLLVAGLGRLFPLKRLRSPQTCRVSVVISSYNDGPLLAQKLDSLLAMEQAEQILEILIGSDGSTDDTAAWLANYPDRRVRCTEFAERRGKPAVLNALLPECRGDVVLLTDVRQTFDSQFLVECLANFADPQVGVVSGELILKSGEGDSTAAEGIGLYWRYEKFLRRAESGFRGVPGATGACYAIRRTAWRPIPDATILDDVAIPMQAIAQGYRCVFEPRAVAYDRPSQSTQQEGIRKRRTIAGAAQLLRLFPVWAVPGGHPLWFEFCSHKLLRLVSPILLASVLVTNVLLLTIPPYGVLLATQLCFYIAASVGWWYQRVGRRSRLFGPALMFVSLNVTTAQALWDACRARYRVTWQKSLPTA